MKFAARFVFFVFCFFVFVLVIKLPTYAQIQQHSLSLTANTSPDVPNNLHANVQSLVIEATSALSCQLVGIDANNPLQHCLSISSKTGQLGFSQNGAGAVGTLDTLISVLYIPPAHVSDYIRYLSKNFGIVKPAYAQTGGFGFTGITPLVGIWTTFRNITYLLFVVIFVVIGLAIMLRVQIDPRTVMSVENQIPKIIVGLILVTFSFAIAGFLIDMMWVGTYVTINVIGRSTKDDLINKTTSQANTPPVGFVNEMYNNQNFGGVLGVANNSSADLQNIVQSLLAPNGVEGILKDFQLKETDPNIGLPGLILGTIGQLISAAVGGLISVAIRGFAFVFIIFALLIALFRLWIQLIKAYVFIILDIVLSPFWIIFGLLPGSPIGFGSWIREMLSNLIAFPTAIGMFMLGYIFMIAFKEATDRTNLFVPPLIGNPSSTSAISGLIGLGVILMTPAVVDMMKDLLKAPQFKYTAAIGQSIGAGQRFVTGSVGQVGRSVFYARAGYYPKPNESGFKSIIRGFLAGGGR